MPEILKTNVCCLDLTDECLDYLKSLDLNVYEGSLGSVFTVKWGHNRYRSAKPLLIDVNIPENLHEYHVILHDMDNPNVREYKTDEHLINHVESYEQRHLECRQPVNTLDLRPFGTKRLYDRFRENSRGRRIEILFVGHENSVEYYSNIVDGTHPNNMGTLSNIEGWNLVSGKEKSGKRVQLEDNNVSRNLFEGRINQVKYCRVFSLPTEMNGEELVTDRRYMSLLCNEGDECVSYLFYYSHDYIQFVLPQVEDKAGVLKDLFENVLFRFFSDYFPDIEARSWIHSVAYQLPEELKIQQCIQNKREEYEREIAMMEDEARTISDKNHHLKQLLTESGRPLVEAVKSFLEWLGFENVIDKDDTLREGELKEEDLCFEYEGTHIYMEVKGINGTSTDAECSQVDKIVNRRMRELKTTDVHGVYVVNHQRNMEPLKRQMPPFNENQIKDAENQSRTLLYTTELFALHSDIENGYITKEQARKDLLHVGLAQFHTCLESLGTPYTYYKEDTVICIDLHNTQISVGDTLYYKDSLQRLVGLNVEGLQQNKQSVDTVSNGKTGIKVDKKVPRNREIFRNKLQLNAHP